MSMIHLFRSKLWHSKVRFTIFASILIFSTSFFNLAMQLYMQSVQSIQTIENRTTTLAMVQVDQSEYQWDSTTQTSRVISYASKHRKTAAQFSTVVGEHPGTTVAATAQGQSLVMPSASTMYHRYDSTATLLAEQMAAFHVRCDRVHITCEDAYPSESLVYFAGDADMTNVGQMKKEYRYTVEATVMDVLSLNDAFYPPLGKITIMGDILNKEDEVFFEEGEECIVYGIYLAPTPEYKNGIYTRPLNANADRYQLLLEQSYFEIDPVYSYRNLDLYRYVEHNDESWSRYRVYSGAYPPIMKPEDPRVEGMLKWIEFNRSLQYVTGISTVEALPLFAMDEAYIVDGRDINREDGTNKNKVCLISQSYAKLNGLVLGDTIQLNMYSHPVKKFGSGNNVYYLMGVYAQDGVAAVTENYTVVGIYKSKDWVANKLFFSPNTIFVPEETIPVAGETGLHYAESLIIQNGTNDQFLQEAKDADIPEGTFSVYDGGYVQYMKSLRIMKQDTQIVLVVCSLLFIVMSFSASSMMVYHLRGDAQIMQKIGATSRYTYAYMCLCIIPIILLSSVISYMICCAVHVPMIEGIESLYLTIRPRYSTLTEGRMGMLINTMSSHPSPIGAIVALIVNVLFMLLSSVDWERRKNR